MKHNNIIGYLILKANISILSNFIIQNAREF